MQCRDDLCSIVTINVGVGTFNWKGGNYYIQTYLASIQLQNLALLRFVGDLSPMTWTRLIWGFLGSFRSQINQIENIQVAC